MDEFKVISHEYESSFNDILTQHVNAGWLPYGQLSANTCITTSGTYQFSEKKLYALLLTRKK